MTQRARTPLLRARFAPRVFELAPECTVARVLDRLRARDGLVALDSAGGSPCRASVVAFDPLRGVSLPGDIAGLRGCLARLRPEPGDAVPGPFQGGFIGALAYDVGVAGERVIAVAPDAWRTPRIVGGLYTDFIVRDEVRAKAWLVLGDAPGDDRPSIERRRDEITAQLATENLRRESAHRPRLRSIGPLVRHTPASLHRARVQCVRERIAEGDIYQANLAHRFTRAIEGDPIDLYLRLRAVNPAPYMAFLAWNHTGDAGAEPFANGALLSASPELLLEFDGSRARTRPIKGTAPRGKTRAEDEARAQALLASAKDLAELAMIVDLERNDLGRIARVGTVEVLNFPRLESYAAVHHLSADVVARVREGCDATDVLAALFPGGSITGAPKLRSMEVIAEVEREGRGFFAGSLGFLDTRGHACFNILIRTLVWRPRPACGAPLRGEVSFHVGGGITWSSDPALEEEETCFKGAALIEALEEPSRAHSGSFEEEPRGRSESFDAKSRLRSRERA